MVIIIIIIICAIISSVVIVIILISLPSTAPRREAPLLVPELAIADDQALQRHAGALHGAGFASMLEAWAAPLAGPPPATDRARHRAICRAMGLMSQ